MKVMCVCVGGGTVQQVVSCFRFPSPREKIKKRATWKGGPDVKRSYVYRLSARSLRRVIMMPSSRLR
jgi:hypothetical protein